MRIAPTLMLLVASVLCAAAGPVNEADGVGIAGYDPVAYFTDDRPVPGDPAMTATHQGVTYRFATAAHRDAFMADPARYLPQYGGYCAFGLSRGYKAVVDPTAFTVAGGRLFLNYNRSVQDIWRRSQNEMITRADENWPAVIASPDVAR